VWGPDKPDEVNAQLVYDALSRMAPARASAPPRAATAPQKAKEGDIVENDKGVRLQLQKGQWVRIK
jgi:hypothetical protein